MSAITIDESRWPVVTVRFEGTASDAEFDAYLGRMSELLARRQVIGTVLDARRAGSTPPIQRRKQADWMKRHERELREQSVGSAFVIDSALVRGLLTAILWIQPIPNEHVVVATIDQADAWIEGRLRARGVTLSDRSV